MIRIFVLHGEVVEVLEETDPRDARRDALMAQVASQARSMLAFFTGRNQKYLCLMRAGESERVLSSQITDESKLVAHPVGYWTTRRQTTLGPNFST